MAVYDSSRLLKQLQTEDIQLDIPNSSLLVLYTLELVVVDKAKKVISRESKQGKKRYYELFACKYEFVYNVKHSCESNRAH